MLLNRLFLFIFILSVPFAAAEAFWPFGSGRAQNEMLRQAQEAYAAKSYETAEDLGKEFLLKYPSAPKKKLKKMYLLLGQSYIERGQYDEALLIYNEAVEFLPKDEDINIALGQVYLVGGLTEKAKDIFLRILKSNPSNKEAVLGLAKANYEDGFFSRATMFFKKYEGLSSDEEKSASFYYSYAMAEYTLGNEGSALELAFKSLEKEENPDTLLLIAKIYKKAGYGANALKYLDYAAQKAPARQDIYLTKALWLSFDPQTSEQGDKMADAFLEQNPDDKLALFIKYISAKRLNKKNAAEYLERINSAEGEGFIDKLAEKLLGKERV